MQISDTFSPSITPLQPAIESKTSLIEKAKTARPKLSMIWVQEFDGERQRLVARWTTQD